MSAIDHSEAVNLETSFNEVLFRFRYHIYCVGLRKVPTGRWHCRVCSVCFSCGCTQASPEDRLAEWHHEVTVNNSIGELLLALVNRGSGNHGYNGFSFCSSRKVRRIQDILCTHYVWRATNCTRKANTAHPV